MSWTLLDPQSLPEVNLGGATVILQWSLDSRFPKVRLDRERAPFPFWMLEELTLERGGPMDQHSLGHHCPETRHSGSLGVPDAAGDWMMRV